MADGSHMTDVETVVLDRIAYDPGAHGALHINWPAGLAPQGVSAPKGQEVPAADVLVVTWTAAEARALADVLTPGVQSSEWMYYSDNWAVYEPQLTTRSPARESHRLASWALVTIGRSRVLCLKSELHPATDGPTLPVAQLTAQLVSQVHPSVVITTGTAGGAGDGTRLGDVNVAATVRSDFTTRLAGKPWSRDAWPCTAATPAQQRWLQEVPSLAPQVQLPGVSGPLTVWNGSTVSTDFFAYDTDDDHFQLRAYDPAIRAVEMDDAAIAAGLDAVPDHVAFYSVRNASDPVMPDATPASAHTAEHIYQRYGYDTTVRSALVTWALIAGLAD